MCQPAQQVAQPARFDRYGDPVFTRLLSPGRGWDRCDECNGNGVAWQWRDKVTGEVVDDAEGSRLAVTGCQFCNGTGWLAPAPSRPRRKVSPGRGWILCDNCEGRGGYYVEDDEAPMNGQPRWYWQKCEDCCVDPDDDRDGLGWWPPDVGTDAEQDDQVRLAQHRLYG